MDKKDNKEEILKTLSNMSVDEIDHLRDTTTLQYKSILRKYYKTKDDLLVQKFEKRRKLLDKGNSANKTENLLRADQEIYLIKRKLIALSEVKKKLELELEILGRFFWRARV